MKLYINKTKVNLRKNGSDSYIHGLNSKNLFRIGIDNRNTLMSKSLSAYIKKNHKLLFYKFVKSRFLVNILSELGFFRYCFCLLQNKPYFGYYLMAAQTWETRKPCMQNLVKREILSCKKGEFRILEIGSWAGNSALTWAEAIRDSERKCEIVCVDPWTPYVKPEKGMINKAPMIMEKALKNNKIFKLFQHNIAAAGISQMVTPLRGTSDNILPTLKKNSFNLAFIDGAHYYSNVIRDLQNTKILLKEGGILCGDDLDLQSHGVDLDYAQANKEINLVIDPKTGKEFHPGVCMAVHNFFQKSVSACNGFWAMRKTENGWQTVDMNFK